MEWINSKMRRLGMPNKKKILAFWQDNDDFKYDIYEHECFACGNITLGLHRCHIIGIMHGGSNMANNLHLLCPSCHNESEGLQEYWTWFVYKRKHDWDYPMNWVMRRLKSVGIDIKEEAEYMKDMEFGSEKIEEHVQYLLNKIMRGTT